MPTVVNTRTSRTSPTVILGEAAGEGMTNLIEAQKVLLSLSKQQNEILMTGLKERIGQQPAAHAVADLLRRSVETFIHMQEEFLKIAGTQTDVWVEAVKAGKPLRDRSPLATLAREGFENFARAQMELFDVIADETAKITGGKRTAIKRVKKTEFSKLASEATASFINAQKELVDIAGKQMNANLRTAGKAVEFLRTFPIPFVGTTLKWAGEHKRVAKPAHRGKKPARRTKETAAAAA